MYIIHFLEAEYKLKSSIFIAHRHIKKRYSNMTLEVLYSNKSCEFAFDTPSLVADEGFRCSFPSFYGN